MRRTVKVFHIFVLNFVLNRQFSPMNKRSFRFTHFNR